MTAYIAWSYVACKGINGHCTNSSGLTGILCILAGKTHRRPRVCELVKNAMNSAPA